METSDLRKAGLKATLPRLKILQVLEANKADHLSAEDVYRMLMDEGEDVGLATIYRVLAQFEDAGLVIRHHFEDGHALFELEQGHHDHIVCVKCGRIEEFFDRDIEQRQRKIAEDNGFDLSKHTLVLYGECQNTNCKKGDS
ncbi:MAG: ferric iron uptake transcriptional regulator [Salinisphaeraceae bacterium]|uniref:Ferric uptake regulation protein n=2 Tax=Spectribacter TaxID=3160928 RepID=A0ABU3BY47_9GAMM|nr:MULTISPECIES: ferric iron uptake transcriptional regulator [unclassified Salinisphaera]MDT0619288.1 ferric iron uptake transcriptional regulator [Salinisphaera sp. P385]MDT0634245.1 ferric iron uptake transcriptional regulator [Salinisphaera sp. W335]